MDFFSYKNNAVFKKTVILILLVALIITFAIAAINFKPTPAYNALSVGFVREPNAYCLILAESSPNSNYQLSTAEKYDDIIDALKDDTLEAALLPVGYLDALADSRYIIIAVTSYLNLAAVENGQSVYSLPDLNGRTVVLPDSLKDSLEYKMLNELLSLTQTCADILFESDAAIREMAGENDFDILMLPAGECAAVLQQNKNFRSCFNLADQWSSIQSTLPPAGYCIVARDDCIKEKHAAISAFLTKTEASVGFVKSKSKKAAAYISSSGYKADIENIWRTIPVCMFDFKQGSGMTEPLEQLLILTQ